MRFKDKVVIVTGGASGMGRLAASRLAQEGAKVTIADIQIEGANTVVDEIKASGHEAIAVKVDVTSFDDTRQMVEAALDVYERRLGAQSLIKDATAFLADLDALHHT